MPSAWPGKTPKTSPPKPRKSRDEARKAEQKELTGLDKALASELTKLGKQRQSLQNKETKEIQSALRILREQHVLSCLRAATVRTARIPGIGPGVVSNLAAYGIVSAADFTGLTATASTRGGRQQIMIKLRTGRLVHPKGVGEMKARMLDAWRKSVEAQARATQPTSLPSGQMDVIRLKYSQQQQVLVNEEQGARVRINRQQGETRQKWASNHSSIAGDLIAARRGFDRERVQIDSRLPSARVTASNAEWQLAMAEREFRSYENVTYIRYLASMFRS
jgi:hypothetical protein